jgi:hypothetical protein
MFGSFKRASQKPARSTSRYVRPTLESLEARDCPSTLTLQITSLAQNKMVTVGGQLTNDPNPSSKTVQLYLSNVPWCYTTPDANGNYRITMAAGTLGTITAETTDGLSNIASAVLADSQTPTVDSFYWIAETGHWFTFYGHVRDDNVQGEIVQFGGMPKDLQGKTAAVDANGNFQFSIQFDGLPDDNGLPGVRAVDWWGLTSAWASSGPIMQT